MIKLKRGREKSLKRRHPWIFSGAVEKATGKAGDYLLMTFSEFGRRVGDSLTQTREATHANLSELKERLAVIATAQKSISELSGQVVGLQELLANKQARGAFGEVQLEGHNPYRYRPDAPELATVRDDAPSGQLNSRVYYSIYPPASQLAFVAGSALGGSWPVSYYVIKGIIALAEFAGVVLLLPHGYEGQGPDHSSARIERFLTMAADEAFVVAQPSTPASHFHLLRRHSLSEKHRPLVVFTPKSMLKRKEAASQPADFTSGEFRAVIGDDTVDPAKVTTVLLVSGRLTWDLVVERQKANRDDVAILRVEQLYPWPVEAIKAELAKYPNARVKWVQDEPYNQGPWPSYYLNVVPHLGREIEPVTRAASSTTAVGTAKRHLEEAKVLIGEAFA